MAEKLVCSGKKSPELDNEHDCETDEMSRQSQNNVPTVEKAVYGGYDYEFVDCLLDRYNCIICAKVLREPRLAVCCGQHFCESCLNKWFDRQPEPGRNKCPHCCAEGDAFHHVINKGLRSEINGLKIKCSHHREGCEWRGELGALKTHLESKSGCGYEDMECPNRCQECHGVDSSSKTTVVNRKDLELHLTHYCYFRPYECKFCGYEDTYIAITGSAGSYGPVPACDDDYFGHQAVCPEVPLACPNRCGSKDIKRNDMDSHRSKCPQEPVECPFAEAGCTGGVVRGQLEDHMASSLQQHLILVMKNSKETKREMQEKLAKAENELTQAKREMQAKLSSTKAELSATKSKLSETESRLSNFIAWSNKLSKLGDHMKIRMPNTSEYSRSGKVWYSPPFYYREGYKMCLAVYANGTGKGAGTHVSVSVLLVGGEFDDRVKWPIQCCNNVNHYIRELPKGHRQFRVCFSNPRLAFGMHKQLGHCDKFLGLTSRALKVNNDSILFKVEFDECYLIVSIV